MLKSHEKFYTVNGKRLVLVVDDEMINREILGNILKNDYEVIFAENGKEALEKIRENSRILGLVLLDLLMPEISGFELLEIIKADPELAHIPVMVMTSEKEAEVKSLNLGASDFLTKPYSQPEVVLARVLKTIELSEDREIIQSTERDPLTGLYNREYFFNYAEQFDQYHADKETDAIVVDINHFRMINERYGKEYGDHLLKTIGERLKEAVEDHSGIVCRREADAFLVYCTEGMDYAKLLQHASKGLEGDGENSGSGRTRLRMGVYQNCDRTLDIERRFDRAKLAADRIRHDFSTSIAFYDKNLHDAQIYSERLLEDFPRAVREKELKVYYQPKFDIRTDKPLLSSAEALVRWIHPELGFINPGVFIPLLEENGLIQQLDYYVWEESARQMKEWGQRYDMTVPVSVNISRIDMYDPDLMKKLEELVDRYEIKPEAFALEITESAYTEDSEQIIETVNKLRSMGFKIEMDDFGTGYSSLNMISSLPIDVLKIDMLFIRSAFSMQKDVRMLELIIDIADYISVPVIAEGVETKEQVDALKALGCEYVQGFYFSKPVPAEEFDPFIEEKKKYSGNGIEEDFLKLSRKDRDARAREAEFLSIVKALASEYFSIYYVNIDTDAYNKYSMAEAYRKLEIEHNGKDFFEDTKNNIERVIYEEDKEKAHQVWDKEYILNELEKSDRYTTSYRIMMDGEPVYIRFNVMKMEDGKNRHIVVGISNVDAQMKKEQEYLKARELARKDALTGLKNKLAYTQAEQQFDERIASGETMPLAIAVCDLNDLKGVNDTFGHAAGDKYIIDACQRICSIFKHSPVFRVGGDEFVAILTGKDFENREALLQMMHKANEAELASAPTVPVIIACGIAEFLYGQDHILSEVFDRADEKMYLDKKQIKESF